MIITHSVEEALMLGERLFVMAPRPGRLHKEYTRRKQDVHDLYKDQSDYGQQLIKVDQWNEEQQLLLEKIEFGYSDFANDVIPLLIDDDFNVYGYRMIKKVLPIFS